MKVAKPLYTAVIIEDEAPIREGFIGMLGIYCPNVKIIGEADGVDSGLELLNKVKPDILFLDIILYDGKGFELLDKLENPSFQLIFITSHNSYALKAFQYNAINYLLKPIDPDLLIESINRLSPKKEDQISKEQITRLSNSYQKGDFDQITLSAKEGLHFVYLENIIRLESSGNLVTFYLETGKRIMITTKSLKDYEKMLPPNDFYRAHQSHIVHRKYISKFLFEDGGYILMSNNSKVPVSRRKKEDFMIWLKS